MVCCFMCSCCYLYQRRQQRGRTPYDGKTSILDDHACADNHKVIVYSNLLLFLTPQSSRSQWPTTQWSPCMTLTENHWDPLSIHMQVIQWRPSTPACHHSTLWCILDPIHHTWWILHTARVRVAVDIINYNTDNNFIHIALFGKQSLQSTFTDKHKHDIQAKVVKGW